MSEVKLNLVEVSEDNNLEKYNGKDLTKEELIQAMNAISDGEILTVYLQEPLKKKAYKMH